MNVNLKNEWLWAAKKGEIESATELLSKDPSLLNSQNSNGKSALHIAVRAEKVEFAKFLIGNGINLNIQDLEKQTALWLATAEEGTTEFVQILINAGAKLDTKDLDERTELHIACVGGNLSIVELLTKAGAKLEVQDSNQCTPLTDSVKYPEIVQHLIDKGVDINTVTIQGNALMNAAYQNTESIRILLKHGADIKATCPNGNTALHYAALYTARSHLFNHKNIQHENIKVLLSAGADPNARNLANKTPINCAQEEIELEIDSLEKMKMQAENGVERSVSSLEKYISDCKAHIAGLEKNISNCKAFIAVIEEHIQKNAIPSTTITGTSSEQNIDKRLQSR